MFSTIRHWFPALGNYARQKPCHKKTSIKTSSRLPCELLEDRTAPAVYDLTGVTPTVTIDNAIFNHAPGLHVVHKAVFLEVRQDGSRGMEQGFNTAGDPQSPPMNTKTATALPLTSIPQVWIGGVLYREFILDANEGGGQEKLLAINEVRLFQSPVDDLTGYVAPANPIDDAMLGTVTNFYNMDYLQDNTLLIDAGRGTAGVDLFFYVRDNLFTQAYVYLYTKMGASFTGSGSYPGFQADNGADHWAVGDGAVPQTAIADITVSKIDIPASTTAIPGTPITYQITVTNLDIGPTTPTVNQVKLDDAVPSILMDPVFAVPVGTSYDAGTGVWSNVDLLPGESIIMTLSGTINPSATGTIKNSVRVDTVLPIGEINVSNNYAEDENTLTPTGLLTITKTDDLDIVVGGDDLTYYITVTNTGPSAVTGLSVTDNLDSLTAFLNPITWEITHLHPGSTTTAGLGPHTGNLIDSIGLLPPDGDIIYKVTTTVKMSAPVGFFTNTSTLTPTGGFTPAMGSVLTASHTNEVLSIAPPTADLAITKTHAPPTVVPGTGFTYSIFVVNNGPDDVVGAHVTDTFGVALQGVNWTAALGVGASGATSGSGNIAETVNLKSGATITYTVTVANVDPMATGHLFNKAVVDVLNTGVSDPDQSNNESVDELLLTPKVDLAVTKVMTTTTAIPGMTASYTITVTNRGPSAVNSVFLNDLVPTILLNPVFAAGAGSSYNSATRVLTFATPFMMNESYLVTLTGTIDPRARGTIINPVRVAPPAGVTDPDLTNNTAIRRDPLAARADLAVTKTANVTSVLPGSVIHYTITVSNLGPSTVSALRLVDTPSGFLLNRVFVANAGTYNSRTGLWSGLILAKGQSITLTITARIAPRAVGTLNNRVVISLPAGLETATDPNLANNRASFNVVTMISKRLLLTSYR